MLAVEALDTALARDAHIYAEIVGWAANADVPLVLGWDPSGDGMAHCMTAALANAGMGVSEISMVAAAAMSHPLHDRAEARAINQVFGRAMPVAAMASRLGASAATAPAAAVAVALGMEDGFLPTGTRLADPDPACDITLLQGPAPTGRIDAALINAAGIGGSNSAIVMRQWA